MVAADGEVNLYLIAAPGADDAARSAGISGFWASIAVFGVLAGCYLVRLLLDMYVTQRFIMRWRIWLSHR